MFCWFSFLFCIILVLCINMMLVYCLYVFDPVHHLRTVLYSNDSFTVIHHVLLYHFYYCGGGYQYIFRDDGS